MSKPKDTRRETESAKLDIDRRKNTTRRDEDQRLWLDSVYKDIYVRNYVNSIHPIFEVKVHAFSNIEKELSQAEWAANSLALTDVREMKKMRNVREFAQEMINMGHVVDSKGTPLKTTNNLDFEDAFLRTGT